MPHGRDADSPFSPIAEILDDLRAGKIIILVDDEDRENEGDLVCAAEHITADMVNFMLRYGRGTLCVPLTRARCERLQLQPQTPVNTTQYGTAFTVTIDGGPHLGVSTGVSSSDRAITIRQTVAEEATPEDFTRPGHVNPLMASQGGVLVRAGQTEGSVASIGANSAQAFPESASCRTEGLRRSGMNWPCCTWWSVHFPVPPVIPLPLCHKWR